MDCSMTTSLCITNSQHFLKLMSIELVMPSNHLILCHPLVLLPSIFPSIRVFSNELALCSRWPKYWSFSFSISPASGYSGLISFRIDWFDCLAVQGTLKSLLQHHSLKASVFQQKGAQASLWSSLTSIHDYQMQVILHTLVLRCITVSRVGKVVTLSLLLLYVRKRRFRGVIII